MKIPQRWVDGRSGWLGGLIGEIVLDHLDPGGSTVQRIKGTVFGDQHHIWVGRIVANESYLSSGVLHWANVSWDQLDDAEREATQSRRKLFFLFITFFAGRGKLVYWTIPSRILSEELKKRSKNSRGGVYGLHISDKNGRHILGSHDVTQQATEVALRPEQLRRLRGEMSPDATPDDVRDATQNTEPSTNLKSFSIPLSEGREARLVSPVPVSEQDITRIKGWIDLMSDVLAGK
jgi:hypothetical protein